MTKSVRSPCDTDDLCRHVWDTNDKISTFILWF